MELHHSHVSDITYNNPRDLHLKSLTSLTRLDKGESIKVNINPARLVYIFVAGTSLFLTRPAEKNNKSSWISSRDIYYSA